MSRVLGVVLPFGSRPFDHRRDLLGQPGEVRVVERFDVRVRRGPLYSDGGPTALDGHHDLQVIGRAGLVSNGLLPGGGGTLRVLCGVLVGVLFVGSRVVRRIAKETVAGARGIRAGSFRSVFLRHGFSLYLDFGMGQSLHLGGSGCGRPVSPWSWKTVRKRGSPHPFRIEPEQLPGPTEPASCKDGPVIRRRCSWSKNRST